AGRSRRAGADGYCRRWRPQVGSEALLLLAGFLLAGFFLARLASAGALFLRHLRTFAPRLGQADGDGLLAAGDLLARAAAAQRAALAFVHGPFDLRRCLLAVAA